jgi:hypothetical protein
MTGVERIAAERKRQIEDESWAAEHDDQYKKDELAMAAACYILPERVRETRFGLSMTIRQILWPWHEDRWKPTLKDRIRELKKAGAMIAAEIDRLLRLEEKAEKRCNLAAKSLSAKDAIIAMVQGNKILYDQEGNRYAWNSVDNQFEMHSDEGNFAVICKFDGLYLRA